MNENEINIQDEIHNLNLNILDLIRTQQTRFITLHINTLKAKNLQISINPLHISAILPNPDPQEGHYSIIHLNSGTKICAIETPEEIHKIINNVN